MLIICVKDKETVQSLVNEQAFAIVCEGCKEVYFPEREAREVIAVLGARALSTEYICNQENLLLQLAGCGNEVETATVFLVFSCGVGVQTVADAFPGKHVYAACDTFALPGRQGVTPTENDCEECGQCYLNDTGGLCPITSCSKGLLNGQCGGAKHGMCEVDKNMQCGWELIHKRIAERGGRALPQPQASIRDYKLGT